MRRALTLFIALLTACRGEDLTREYVARDLGHNPDSGVIVQVSVILAPDENSRKAEWVATYEREHIRRLLDDLGSKPQWVDSVLDSDEYQPIGEWAVRDLEERLVELRQTQLALAGHYVLTEYDTTLLTDQVQGHTFYMRSDEGWSAITKGLDTLVTPIAKWSERLDSIALRRAIAMQQERQAERAGLARERRQKWLADRRNRALEACPQYAKTMASRVPSESRPSIYEYYLERCRENPEGYYEGP